MADKGYKMIFSNVDSLYLDCGFGAWVGEGNNWCTPYKGWQKIYSNDLYKNLEEQGVKINDNNKKLVLGAEVCMWAEQVLFLKKVYYKYEGHLTSGKYLPTNFRSIPRRLRPKFSPEQQHTRSAYGQTQMRDGI